MPLGRLLSCWAPLVSSPRFGCCACCTTWPCGGGGGCGVQRGSLYCHCMPHRPLDGSTYCRAREACQHSHCGGGAGISLHAELASRCCHGHGGLHKRWMGVAMLRECWRTKTTCSVTTPKCHKHHSRARTRVHVQSQLEHDFDCTVQPPRTTISNNDLTVLE